MIINNSGGGAPLNFKVVGGTTEPANPKENTIWVNTDAEITGWVFSAEQPKSPAEGMIWFRTGTNFSTPFNALKKNNITVYPNSCKQYVGGAWVNNTTKIYQSGVWVEVLDDLYVLKRAVDTSDVTGVWIGNNHSVVMQADGTTKFSRATSGGEYGLFTEKFFDLTYYKTLEIEVITHTGYGSISYHQEVAIINSSNAVVATTGDLADFETKKLDVTGMVGNHRIIIYLGNGTTLTIGDMIFRR